MDEAFRMLGREHQADLEREARKWQQAAESRGRRGASVRVPDFVRPRDRLRCGLAQVAAFVGRAGSFVALLAVVVIAGPSSGASAARTTATDSLVRAATIRAEVDGRYPGLRITEASSTAVIDSVTLFTADADPRVVPATNGIYFAVCPIRATCPYPGRAARPASAFAPRRLALELAVRTFLETEADLVLVSLPTPRFVLLVFERTQLDAGVISEELANAPVVDSATLPRLFEGFALEPCPNGRDTLLALSLDPGRTPEHYFERGSEKR